MTAFPGNDSDQLLESQILCAEAKHQAKAKETRKGSWRTSVSPSKQQWHLAVS